jgi:hypothetical protein
MEFLQLHRDRFVIAMCAEEPRLSDGARGPLRLLTSRCTGGTLGDRDPHSPADRPHHFLQ